MTRQIGDTLVTVNPFIYKGYYYDSETDWYYLKSRYYCPVLSRFINMDETKYLEPGSIQGVNLFSYCYDIPIMYVDDLGTTPKWLSEIGTTIEHFAIGMGALLKFSIKSLPRISLAEAVKLARKGGHFQSARSIIRGREKTISDTLKMSKSFKTIAKWTGRAMLALDIGFSLYDNIKNNNDSWITDSIVDISIGVIIYGIGAIPVVGWALSIGVAVGVNYLEKNTSVISDFKNWAADVGDDISDGWTNFWSFSWV